MDNENKELSFVCVICGETFNGIGNNPEPIYMGEDDRCCDNCNDTKVIPARLKQMGVK